MRRYLCCISQFIENENTPCDKILHKIQEQEFY